MPEFTIPGTDIVIEAPEGTRLSIHMDGSGVTRIEIIEVGGKDTEPEEERAALPDVPLRPLHPPEPWPVLPPLYPPCPNPADHWRPRAPWGMDPIWIAPVWPDIRWGRNDGMRYDSMPATALPLRPSGTVM